jgi:hypothetical protein
MTSQATLVSRLGALERVIGDRLAITDSPDKTEHNESARILRNGLAVMAFAILEDFARTRAAELFLQLQANVVFASLPPKLQQFATVGVIEALMHRKRYLPVQMRQAFIQVHAAHVASTTEAAYTLSPLAALNTEPNVQDDALSEFLKSLCIDAPWDQIAAISPRLGFGPLDARQAYKELSRRRNEAAHEASSSVEHSDLLASVDAVLCIAVAMDVLCSTAVRAICNWTPGTPPVKVTAADVFLRRIDKVTVGATPRWRETRENVRRAVKVHSTADLARQEALSRATRAHESVVEFLTSKRPIFWVGPM